MKKKLLAILMIIVIAVTAIMATACTKNTERDFKRATATVTYKGRTAQVDKLELNATIYNFVYQYYSYYSQGYLSQAQYQSVLDNIGTSYKQANESLAETEAYTLRCIDALYEIIMAGTDETMKAAAKAASTVGKPYDPKARIKEIESVLPKKDLIAAVEAYNEEMQTSFDNFLDAYETEIENGAKKNSTDNVSGVTIISAPWKVVYEKGESLNESGLKVGATYEGSDAVVELDRNEYTVTGFSSDTVKSEVEITVTFSNKTATFNVEIIDAKASRPKMPTEDEEEEEKTEVPALFEVALDAEIAEAKTSDPARYKALTESKRRLEKQMTANYRSYEYYYLAKLKTQVVTAYEEIVGKTATGVSTEEIVAEYTRQLNDQKQELLFGTSKYKEKVDSTAMKTQIVHADGKYFYVHHVLFKLSPELEEKYTAFEKEKVANEDALETYKNGLIDQTKIYVSNVEYDKDATCEDEECKCTACSNYKGENPGPCNDPECECVKCPNKRYVDTISYGNDQTLNADENGTFGILELLAALYDDIGEVTAESTAADRAANLATFKKWIYMCGEDEGFFTTLSDGKLGYSLSMDESTWVENFTACARALAYGDAAEKAEWHVKGVGVGSYGYCYTTFGIHVIMLSGYALDPDAATTDEGNGYVAIDKDTVTDYSSYKPAETDEDTQTPAKGTIAYGIVETLENEKKENAIGDFKKDFYQNDLKKEVKITYYPKVYKDLIKQYEK